MKSSVFAFIALAACAEPIERSSSVADDLSSENGLSLNGRSLNGTSLNGTSLNGLDLGLATRTFQDWFHADPTSNEIEMRYVVKCARASGDTVSWTDPASNVSYAWPGELGLAPTWTNRPMTPAEQQVMTACMLAHANKYGVHVPIAIEGQTASGVEIARASDELTTYSVREAAFFGNTVSGDGAFVCLDHATWDASRSSARACGYDTSAAGNSTVCPPIVQVGACNDFCTQDKTKTYYTSCKYNAKTFQPLTTRLRPQDIYKCGDGTCQFTEHCGNGATYDNCRADCGLCPAT